MYALDGWKIKLRVLYIHYYREWLCNGRCISTGWSKLEVLLNGLLTLQFTECKDAIKENYQATSQGNRTWLFMAMNWTFLTRPTPPPPFKYHTSDPHTQSAHEQGNHHYEKDLYNLVAYCVIGDRDIFAIHTVECVSQCIGEWPWKVYWKKRYM